MDPTAIQPTAIQTAIPAPFSASGWSQAFGNLTSTVEGWFGQNGVSNSAQAVNASTLPGQPSTTAAAPDISSAGSALLHPIDAIASVARSGADAVEGEVSGAWNSVTGGISSTVSGLSSTLKWVVVGLVAVAVIYALAQLKVLEGLL